MSEIIKMRPCRLARVSCRMSLDKAIAWASEHIASGWILAESPEKIVWQPFQAQFAAGSCHFTSLIIFDANAELRLHLAYGADEGDARLITVDDVSEPCLERISSYLAGKGRLEYGEVFRKDNLSGAYKLEFGRYCGLREA